MKGKFIGTNVRKVQDAMYCIASNPEYNSIVLFLDFCKAFDSVSHDFMMKLMAKMGYPNSIFDWISIIYKNSVAMVRHKGWFTAEFPIQ